MLLTRTVASELSASVIASTFALSSFVTFAKNFVVSKCFGVSSSTMTVGPALTLVVKLFFLTGIEAVSYTHLTLPTKA